MKRKVSDKARLIAKRDGCFEPPEVETILVMLKNCGFVVIPKRPPTAEVRTVLAIFAEHRLKRLRRIVTGGRRRAEEGRAAEARAVCAAIRRR